MAGVGREGDDAVEREVVEAAEVQVALDLGGVADGEGRAAGEEQGAIFEDQVVRAADRTGSRDGADPALGGAGVDVEPGVAGHREVAGEDGLAAEG